MTRINQGKIIISSRVPCKVQSSPMTFEQIPKHLFEYLSKEFGNEVVRQIENSGQKWIVGCLESSHPEVGFHGDIGYGIDSNGRNVFVVWERHLFVDDEGTVFEPQQLFAVTAGKGYPNHRYVAGSPGVWFSWRQDTLGGTRLDHPAIAFATVAQAYASKLYQQLKPKALDDYSGAEGEE